MRLFQSGEAEQKLCLWLTTMRSQEGIKRLRLPCSGCQSETPACWQSKRGAFLQCKLLEESQRPTALPWPLFSSPGPPASSRKGTRPRGQETVDQLRWRLICIFFSWQPPWEGSEEACLGPRQRKVITQQRGFSDQKYLRGQVSPDCALGRAGEAQNVSLQAQIPR